MLLLLAGCTAVPSDVKVCTGILPDVKPYTRAFQEEAAKEMDANKSPALSTMTVDYGVMRDQTRVALGQPTRH